MKGRQKEPATDRSIVDERICSTDKVRVNGLKPFTTVAVGRRAEKRRREGHLTMARPSRQYL